MGLEPTKMRQDPKKSVSILLELEKKLSHLDEKLPTKYTCPKKGEALKIYLKKKKPPPTKKPKDKGKGKGKDYYWSLVEGFFFASYKLS